MTKVKVSEKQKAVNSDGFFMLLPGLGSNQRPHD
jgi:hypothetical protein